MTESVEDRVVHIVVSYLELSAEDVCSKLDLPLEDLGADSLDQVEIVLDVEECFNIEIDDSVAEKLKTTRDVINHVAGVVVGN